MPSVVRLFEAHAFLYKLKRLFCKKCGRTTVGLENTDDAQDISEEAAEFLAKSDTFKNFELILAKNAKKCVKITKSALSQNHAVTNF